MSSYKEKFDALEERAHYQIIATKVLRELSSQRSLVENSPTASRRWIWELIQNAKDAAQDTDVDIEIEFQDRDNPYVLFSHNGKPFSADNLRYLIEQISSKDRSKDDSGKYKSTGKFGTGFLTTHLLSEIVDVTGVAKEDGLDYRKFKLRLDRTGIDLQEIIDAVKAAKASISNLDKEIAYASLQEEELKTHFRYELDSVGLQVAQEGLADLDECLPYTFAFVDNINSVELNGIYHRQYLITSVKRLNNNITLITVSRARKHEKELTIAVLTKNFTTIALPVVYSSSLIEISYIKDDIPKLFCDFPLVGTEKFHFPVIVNNPNFNPTDPRDGVFLTTSQRGNQAAEQNREYLKEAVELYKILVDYACDNGWKNLHLLARIKAPSSNYEWVDDKWFLTNILVPIRSKLLHSKIVTTADDNHASILQSTGQRLVWFPATDKPETRKQIWELGSSWFSHALPSIDDIEIWHKIIWKECGQLTVDQLSDFVEQLKSKSELEKVLADLDPIEWLNKLYALLIAEEIHSDSVLNKRAIFPDQNGNFHKRDDLRLQKGKIDEDLKDILNLLGNDIRKDMADENLLIELPIEKGIDEAHIIREINTEVNEKSIDRNISKKYREGFKKLLLWFKANEGKAKNFFPGLFAQKYLLYNDEEILENMDKAESLDKLFTDFKVHDISQIRALLDQAISDKPSILPITENILVSLGITSLPEFEKAMEDKDLAELYAHQSTPTTDMFVYVQTLIKQAKESVIAHLRLLPEYDLNDLDESTANTILAGIKKLGRDITIVVRPAYNKEVIIYYSSERDIMDYTDFELWVDDGVVPQQITFGHILKTAQIVKFPI